MTQIVLINADLSYDYLYELKNSSILPAMRRAAPRRRSSASVRQSISRSSVKRREASPLPFHESRS